LSFCSSLDALSSPPYREELLLSTLANDSVLLGTMGEMIQLAYGPDVVKRVIQNMTEFDSSFKLPDGFFLANPEKIQANGNENVAHDL